MLAFIGNAISTLTAGDTWILEFNDDDHPVGLWTAAIAFSRNGTQLIAKAGTPNGSNFKFSLTAAETSTLVPGYTQVYVVFTNVADTLLRESEFAGTVTLLPNPTGTMPPTPSQQALTAVLASITIILAQPESSATFNGQTYTMQNIQTLYQIRNQLIADVNNELRALGLTMRGGSRNILTRFR
jgi:hypothetical protein